MPESKKPKTGSGSEPVKDARENTPVKHGESTEKTVKKGKTKIKLIRH